jgi:sporulation protein YlmC with PRC-barrel domain
MKIPTYAALLIALASTTASAQAPQAAPQSGGSAQILTSVPANSVTVTHWYKQNVYDPADSKIGQIMDVLVDHDGKAQAFVIGVGGFLGMGEKDVLVPFDAVKITIKDSNKWYLVMNATADALKSANGYVYDRNAMTWIPEESAAATTGSTGMAPSPGMAPRPSTR